MLAWMPGFLSLALWLESLPTQAGGALCQNLSKIARRGSERDLGEGGWDRKEGRGKVELKRRVKA